MPRIVEVTNFTPSKSARKANNKTANRLQADGRDWRFDRFDVEAPADVVDSMVRLRRARDHASGRRSHLDAPHQRAFYVETVSDLLDQGRAAVHTLTVDDSLAGYAISLHDHDVHRVWDGRVGIGFERYRAGTACTWRVLEDAKADPSVVTVDWLRGMTLEKIHNDVVTLPCLRATSHGAVDRMDRWTTRARSVLTSLVRGRLRTLLIGRA